METQASQPYELRVWAASIGKYNSGQECGGWITLPASTQELESFKHDIARADALHEEVGVFDDEHEGMIARIGYRDPQRSSLDELNLLAFCAKRCCEKFGPEAFDGVNALMDYQGGFPSAIEYCNALLQADEITFYPYENIPSYATSMSLEEKLGRSIAAVSGLYDVLKEHNVEHLFDYKQYGEEQGADYEVHENGYLDLTTGGPQLDLYDKEDLEFSFEAELDTPQHEREQSVDEKKQDRRENSPVRSAAKRSVSYDER